MQVTPKLAWRLVRSGRSNTLRRAFACHPLFGQWKTGQDFYGRHWRGSLKSTWRALEREAVARAGLPNALIALLRAFRPELVR